MKLFSCQCCGQVLHFENSCCLGCGRALGYLAEEDRLVAVEPLGANWQIAGESGTAQYRFCRNWELSACNWLVPAEGAEFCATCQHNRTIPPLDSAENLQRWQRIENAKRRLIYTLRHLDLPLPLAGSGHPEPLIFDFLDDQIAGQSVMTGHDNGVITIALSEADDAHREAMRAQLGESYRTLLGHFRHEIGHYYWDLLIRDGGNLQSFTALFGDASQDYAAALDRHYAQGAPEGWQQNYVSAYATMHPWEDWAETWAHYLHMIDSLDTAAHLGLQSQPEIAPTLAARLNFDPWAVQDSDRLLAAWTPLSIALNEMNRAMGVKDLYPFAISAKVAEKLAYIHGVIRNRGL